MDISATNLSTLRHLSTAVRTQPDVIEAAKTSTNAEFVQKIRQDHPQQHISARVPLRWVFDEGQANTVKGAIRKAMERGAQNEAEAILDICINYEADCLIEENLKEAGDGSLNR